MPGLEADGRSKSTEVDRKPSVLIVASAFRLTCGLATRTSSSPMSRRLRLSGKPPTSRLPAAILQRNRLPPPVNLSLSRSPPRLRRASGKASGHRIVPVVLVRQPPELFDGPRGPADPPACGAARRGSASVGRARRRCCRCRPAGSRVGRGRRGMPPADRRRRRTPARRRQPQSGGCAPASRSRR